MSASPDLCAPQEGTECSGFGGPAALRGRGIATEWPGLAYGRTHTAALRAGNTTVPPPGFRLPLG